MLFLKSVKVGASQLKTVFRLLPIIFVVFLPMAPLDRMVLDAHYEILGEHPLPDNVSVHFIDAHQSEEELEALFESFQSEHCIAFNLDVSSAYCTSIDLNSRYTQNSVLDLRPLLEANLGSEDESTRAQDASWLPFFYQRFPPPADPTPFDSPASSELIVLLPHDPLPPFHVSTPLGEIPSHELAINLAINAHQKSYIQVGSYTLQIALGFILATLYLLFPYQFPISIGGLVFLAASLSYYLLSFFLFKESFFLMPTAGPLISLGASYILSATDRLSRREEIQRELEYNSIRLQELDRLKTHFLSLISHDLKTPIARMQTLLEQLFESLTHPSEKTAPKELLTHALAANDQLQRSIDTLLLLNRIENQDFSIQRRPTDLPALIESILPGPRELALEAGIEIRTEMEPMFLVDLDSGLIREVILNLVDNAIKFTPSGRNIYIRCGESENSVWIEIQDEGTGIPVADRDKVLQMFFQGSNDGKIAGKASHGSGLGLYLCSFFVNEHKGAIEVFSRCEGEDLQETAPAYKFFHSQPSGTLVRVALPLDSIYARAHHEN